MRWRSASDWEATKWPQERSQEAYGVCRGFTTLSDANRCFSESLSSHRFADSVIAVQTVQTTGKRHLAHGAAEGLPMTKTSEDIRRDSRVCHGKCNPTSRKSVNRCDLVVHPGLTVLAAGARGKVGNSLLYSIVAAFELCARLKRANLCR